MSRNTVLLRFKSERAKSQFLGQLGDGWGENWVDLSWEGDDLGLAPIIDVSVFEEDGSEFDDGGGK